MQKEQVVKKLIPFFVSLILSIVTLIIYLNSDVVRAVVVVEILACALIPLILPIIEFISKKSFPTILNILIVIHIFLAIDLGTVLGFYKLISWWDLLLHFYFGFIGAVVIFVFMHKWNGLNINKFGLYFMIFLAVMGLAGLWEVWEYICDRLFVGNDAQNIAGSIASGVSVMTDSMTDIMISIPGVFLFYLLLLIDKITKKNLTEKILLNDKNLIN